MRTEPLTVPVIDAERAARPCWPPRSTRPRPRTWPVPSPPWPTRCGCGCCSLIAAAGEVCSCDLQEPLGKSQPTVSHHTKALAEAGLIVGEKRGRWVYWRVVPERVEALRAALAP